VTARAVLRAATAADHERVDRLFSSLDLAREADYRLFLMAQATAHLPVEEAIEAAGARELLRDWPERKRAHLLRDDLADLGAQVPPPIEPPALPDAASIFGAIYVLEGSRLGGALLKRGLPAGLPKRFLDAEQAPGAWRKLLAKLDEFVYAPEQLEAATEAARQVFMRFETAGRRYLETVQT
jgi:heme oxygenase